MSKVLSGSLNPFGDEKIQEEIKMLDNLVESKNNSENTARRGGYLLTTSVLVFSLFASGILWSLFAKELNIGGDSMELSSMVAPVPVPADEPPAPEPVKEIKQTETNKTVTDLPVRNSNIARIEENQPIPDKVSSEPSKLNVRPNGKFIVDPDGVETNGTPTGRGNSQSEVGNSPSQGVVKPSVVEKPETEELPPPAVKKKEEPKEVAKPKIPPTISKGVINGTAVSLPSPPYPPAAKAIRVSGDVSVQVTIDEQGNVISANAVSGPALLKQASEQAARRAKFRPTLLSDQPVKVTGIIVYKFTAQ